VVRVAISLTVGVVTPDELTSGVRAVFDSALVSERETAPDVDAILPGAIGEFAGAFVDTFADAFAATLAADRLLSAAATGRATACGAASDGTAACWRVAPACWSRTETPSRMSQVVVVTPSTAAAASPMYRQRALRAGCGDIAPARTMIGVGCVLLGIAVDGTICGNTSRGNTSRGTPSSWPTMRDAAAIRPRASATSAWQSAHIATCASRSRESFASSAPSSHA
jgi:hypothetical protein